MRTTLASMWRALAFTLFAWLANWAAFGMGADHPTNHVGNSSWPKGMAELVNSTNRVHGFWVNAEDLFFFSGSAAEFTAFLATYAKIEGIEKHLLILHDGAGEAKSPWAKTGGPCDWKVYGCPKRWRELRDLAGQSTNAAELALRANDAKDRGTISIGTDGSVKLIGPPKPVQDTNYVLEVHFWTGGKIALDQLTVPKNVEFVGGCLKVFDSITNGMTRAAVEKAFALDGGLQSASPVRLLHRNCPLFKVNVEFDFKRDAADQNRAIPRPEDAVIRVSKPCFERPFMD